MNYAEFKEQIAQEIKTRLPEEYADAEVSIVPTVKNNDTVLDGLLIAEVGEGTHVTPAIYLNGFYNDYQDGRSMDDILDSISNIRMKNELIHSFDTSQIMDFDKAKDHIVCRLINGEDNQQNLADKPHTNIEDLSVTYHIQMQIDGAGSCSAPVTYRILENYGISLEELHDLAVKNMEELMPYQFRNLNEIMKEMLLPDTMNEYGVGEEEAKKILENIIPESEVSMYCLTSEDKTNAAALILNDNIMEAITEQLGGEFFILPSSVHETLIVPKSQGVERADLEAMVQEVNATQVEPEERLSDHVYEYDAKEHQIVRSDSAEAQREAKLEQREKGSLKEKLAEKKEQAHEKTRLLGDKQTSKKAELGLA